MSKIYANTASEPRQPNQMNFYQLFDQFIASVPQTTSNQIK